jgi:hypothetical protein
LLPVPSMLCCVVSSSTAAGADHSSGAHAPQPVAAPATGYGYLPRTTASCFQSSR